MTAAVTSTFADQFQKLTQSDDFWDVASNLSTRTTPSDIRRGLRGARRELDWLRRSPRGWLHGRARDWSPEQQGTDVRYAGPAVVGAGVGAAAGLPLAVGLRKLTKGRKFIRGPGALLSAAAPLLGAAAGATYGQVYAANKVESDWDNMSPVRKFQTVVGLL